MDALTYFTKTNIVVFLFHYLLHWLLFLEGNKTEPTPLIGLIVHGELYGFNLTAKKKDLVFQFVLYCHQ